MAISKELKTEIVKTYQINDKDTGSAEVQIAILTAEINQLNGHLAVHTHDFHSKRGLFLMIGRRKRLLTYLKNEKPEAYEALIAKLQIRG